MRRTLYLSMACLLSALSVAGQTGSRDLNPIEKQKLQLPELPVSQVRSSMLRSGGNADYTKGTFIVNEDWYGHQNSSVNFFSDDGTWTYNAFQKENPGHELGCTSQFGAIYGDLLYIVSKQSKDGAASVEGSRLAVIDAKTMKVKKEFQKIGEPGADGRSFLGVDLTKGYIGTSNGIYVFYTGYDANSGTYDESKMSIETTAIDGTTGISAGDLYHSQIGSMVRVGKYVFAVHQTKGLLVIDPEKDEVVNTLLKPEENSNHGLGSIVLSKDGSLWASVTFELTGSGATMPYLWKVNPYTLTTQKIDIPTSDGMEEIPNSWYAWTADGFCASTKENKIYWKGQGSGSWFTGYKVFCYDIDKDSFYQVFDFTKLDKGDWRLYGTGFRIDPVDDNMYCFLYHEFLNPEHELAIIKTDGRGDTNGTMVGRYPYEKVNYWFPALPVFPDNIAPTITDGLPSEITFSAENTKYSKSMDEIIEDGDNMVSAVVTTIENPNPELINVEVINNTLTIAPIVQSKETKEVPLVLSFNSNGKIVNKTLVVKLSASSAVPFAFKEKELTMDGKGKSVTLMINGLEGEAIEWTSLNPNIAEVSEQGVVTSKAYGTVKIQATSKDRKDKSDVCVITIKRRSMGLSKSSFVLYIGESESLTPDGDTETGLDATTEEIEWKSLNEEIVILNGMAGPHPRIQAISEGETEVWGTITSKETGEELSITKCKVKVLKAIPVAEIVLRNSAGDLISEGPISIEMSQQIELKAIVTPEDATNKTVKWSSSDASFSVKDGVVTACGVGEATITATSGEVEVSCKVVCPEFEVERVEFTNKIFGIKASSTPLKTVLPISYYPGKTNTMKASNASIEWIEEPGTKWGLSFTDSEITIQRKGTSAKRIGKAKITATVEDSKIGKSYPIECLVVVSNWANSLTLNEYTHSMQVGDDPIQIGAVVDYGSLSEEERENKKLLYSSADETVAKIDENGLITAVGEGKTTVKAYLSDGSNDNNVQFKGECQVFVCSVPVEKVVVQQKEIRIKRNETIQLKAQIYPENATFSSIEWSGNNVTSDGFFSGSKTVGEVIAYAKSEDGLFSDTCVIYIQGDIPAQSLKIEPRELSIDMSQQNIKDFMGLFKYSYFPENASICDDVILKIPKFTIEDEEVLKFVLDGSFGYYRPRKVGTTKVFFKAKADGVTDEILLHVTDRSTGMWGVTLEASQMVASVGGEQLLKYEVQTDPSKPDVDKSVTWSSSDENVASIDPETGKIQALSDGETTIRVTTNTGGFVASCTLSVGEGIIKVTGVSLDQERLELKVGEGALLKATITPENAKTKVVNWLSDDRFVVDIDKDGNVKAMSEGTATITAETLDGGYTATCKVIVSAESEKPGANVTGVSLNASSLSLNKGEEAVLAAVVSPASAINKSVTWSSSDATVAMVGSNGTVKAGIAGVATITVTTDEGGYTATCEVTVIDPDLEKPVVEVQDSTAILTFPKVPEATFYEVSVYKYVNEIPVLFGVYTTDADGNVLTGLMSELRSGEQEKIKVSIPELDGSSEYIVKVTVIKEGNGSQEILGTFYSEPFSTSGPVGNEAIGAGEVAIYYQDGQLHLNNLMGYHCYIISLNGAILDIFEVMGINESRLISYSRGAYIITLVKDDDRISKKIVINK
ncbi:MAG: Ig-like domain-containing protein [Parabacteroides sp.]|nr:Ig-like domain-containing protein [Parabacteroides sp.]